MFLEVPGYEISDTLFNNAQTVVHRATRNSDGKTVILKQLIADFPDAGRLSRFSFGYEVLSQFDHPNIIKALDWIRVGQREQFGDQSRGNTYPTMVLEDIQGVDLFTHIKSFDEGVLPVEVFLNIAIQLAEALSVIHYHQVIHKDLHPGNIIVSPETGHTQIADFGLASLLSREQPMLEIPEHIEGVLEYISPEQTGRMNRAVDYRSDFYTLGATFYYLLAGHVPFSAEDALGIVHAHIAKPQCPLCTIRPEIPDVLSQIVDKLLKKTAEERYQSALGLKKDLEKVRYAFAANKPIPDFPLGMEDISDRFQIPQKLYGRDQQVSQLMKSFFQAAGGKPRMLSICGYSGIGKSALVHEIHKPIAAYNGLFCSGKFDQFQKNVPYSALQSALKGWIQHTLSYSKQRLHSERHRLNSALGANARVLIDFMQEFAFVLGELPAVTALGADETQNRFHLVFQHFMQLITHDRPIVLFIDDIQWADRGTLNLLPLLLGDISRLLIIVAYRDNEVDSHHPSMETLKKIRKSPDLAKQLSEITLGPLNLDQLSDLLQDALHRPSSEILCLAKLVYAKTAGNPFFIGEFLKALYTNKLLDFNLNQQRWCWDIDQIELEGITDNVVELMLSKMRQLPECSQSLIQLAACVGSTFHLDMLARIAELDLMVVARRLWPALRDGLLLQDGGDWHLGMIQQDADLVPIKSEEDHVLSQSSPISPQCRFLHDRMLQAAYQSMSAENRRRTHLRVGRILLKHSQGVMTNEECFSIVEQFNKALDLLETSQERISISRMNLRAAKQAWAASVWEAAAEYSQIGIDLLPENAWELEADLTKELYRIKAESEYLTGHPEMSGQFYHELIHHVESDLDRAEFCATRLVQCVGHGVWTEGMAHAKQGLDYLGMKAPEPAELDAALQYENAVLMENSLDGLIKNVSALPDMTDIKLLIAVRVLVNLSSCAIVLKQLKFAQFCLIKSCNLMLQFGKCDLSAIILAHYSFHLVRQGKLLLAIEQEDEAQKLVRSYSQCREISNCYNIFGMAIGPLKLSFENCIALTDKGKVSGLENGDLARAAINYGNSLIMRFTRGELLRRVQEEAISVEAFVLKQGAFHPAGSILRKLSEALTGVGNGSYRNLDDASFSAEVLNKIKCSFHFSYLLHYRGVLSFWFGEFDRSLELMRQVTKIESLLPNILFLAEHYFYYGFLLAQNCSNPGQDDRSDLDRCVVGLEVYQRVYEPNFKHKYLLLRAETRRARGESLKSVCEDYRDAIGLAQCNGFIQIQALANERFASYWLEQGFESIATPFVKEALYLYRSWGCSVKVQALKAEYDNMLPISEVNTGKKSTYSEAKDSQETQALDMASVMKSAQLISSELYMTKLSAKVLGVIVECAGASSGALVIAQESSYNVVALSNEDSILVPEIPISLDSCDDLPINVVRYVLNSHEMVNVGDLVSEQTFYDDQYLISRQPKSLLCVPVNYRDKLIGALYLENLFSAEAFTDDRLDVIHLLLAQAAISYENAQLFDEVTQLNENLERKVEKRTSELATANISLNAAVQDLQAANKDLNAFTHTVSHDLRAPLRGIKGFTDVILEDFESTLDGEVKVYLNRVIRNTDKMTDLIEGLLELSKLQKQEVRVSKVDLSALVESLFTEMRERFPDQMVTTNCIPGCIVDADQRMMYSVMENLISNAWKYSSKTEAAKVEFGYLTMVEGASFPEGVGDKPETFSAGQKVFYIRDNGSGFDMTRAGKLFSTFQRLHPDSQFPGTGVGLSTVKRILEKHGGYIWANSAVNEGTTFYFVCNADQHCEA
ncbi:protein kinase domain-containing protein [Oleiphilus messinensis]|uniref:protein kinase domain-containing protein n=1 Tax=Oleiphilus messinensis TaxID=141451 RepID=UPI0018DFDE69|nr:AAA family ATPase [Oleiphilus messinensis]